MNVCLIGCWYRDDIYTHNCYNLVEGLKRSEDFNIKFVTSNCHCFSSSQTYGITKGELLNSDCDVVKIPFAPPDPSKTYGLMKYYIVKLFKLNFFLEISRGISFFIKTKKCDIVHFDQVLKSFGFLSFLTLVILLRMLKRKIVVTVHELDPLQEKYMKLNRYYNKVDKVIVFSEDFKQDMMKMGVKEEKIIVIHYGVSLMPVTDLKRDQFIFFGGHKLLKRKGYDTLLNAMKLLESKGKTIKLLIYVGEGCIGLEEGKKKIAEMQLEKQIEWTELLYGTKLAEAYQKSIGCIIPYTGGSGRYPSTSAMANATPVIATRKASMPEYLGDLGLYIEENSAEELADAIISLMDNPDLVKSLGGKLRDRAEKLFGSDLIAKKVSEIYINI